jgi:hypothetical protein
MPVVVHGSVLQQSGLQDTMRGSPMQYPIPRSSVIKACLCPSPRCHCTDEHRTRHTRLMWVWWVRGTQVWNLWWSSLPDQPFICIAIITIDAISKARKITQRRTSTLQDRWYMAYKRMIMMTCIIYQSSQCYRWDSATEQLTTQHEICDNTHPVRGDVKDEAWKKLSDDHWWTQCVNAQLFKSSC